MGSKTDDLLLLRVTDTDHNLRASRNGLDGEVDQLNAAIAAFSDVNVLTLPV